MGKYRLPAAVLLLFGATVARAESPEERFSPEVRITSCPDALAGALPAIVRLEIDVLLRERGSTRAPPEWIAVRCSDDRAFIEVAMNGATRQSSLDLAELAPEHRARAVALATAELVHSMANADVTAPTRVSPSEPKPHPPELPPPLPAPPDSPRPTLSAGGLLEWVGAPKTVLFGARLSLRYPVGSLVVPALSLDGALGDTSSSSANVQATTLGVTAAVYFGVRSGNARWEAGPGMRVGWARLSGHPEPDSELRGRSLNAWWAGPELRARAAYGASRAWSPTFALELGTGVVVLPVHGLIDGEEAVFALEGAWLSASAQVGVTL